MSDAEAPSATPTYDALNTNDKGFVDDLLAGKPQYAAYRDNIYKAKKKKEVNAEEPSYNYLCFSASRKIRKDKIARALSERYDEEAMTDAEAAHILARHARGTMHPFVQRGYGGGLVLDSSAPEFEANLHLVKEWNQEETVIKSMGDENEGEAVQLVKIKTRVKLYDAHAAADKIRRAHGAYTEHVKVSGEVILVKVNPAGTDPDA